MALHSEFVAVMVREQEEPYYRTLSAFPPGHAPISLMARNKVVALVRALAKPLDGLATGSDWLHRLPSEDLRAVRQTGIDLLVPIAVAGGRREAVLALGVKKSEEPYTREDQELLEAISSSLALLFDHAPSAGHLGTSMFQECPECGACYDSGSDTCATDGVALRSTRLPRTLVGRYRLEKRRGRGGMGTVYEAG